MFDRLHRYIKSVGAAWGLLLGFVLVALGVAYFYSPTRLTVAVVKGAEERIFRELGARLNQGRVLRLKIEEFPDFRATAAALEAKRADLAVIQPDVIFPTNAGTIAILREEMLIVLVPAKAKIEDAAGLANKRIATVIRRQSDSDLMNRTLAHYDLAARMQEIPADEFFTGVRSDRIDALAFLAAPGTPFAQQMMEAATRLLG